MYSHVISSITLQQNLSTVAIKEFATLKLALQLIYRDGMGDCHQVEIQWRTEHPQQINVGQRTVAICLTG